MLLIKNASILTMAKESYMNGYIIVNEGKIIEIGDMKQLAECQYDNIIDAQSNYVLPGFIDAHCHIGLVEDAVGFEGDDVNESTDPVTPHLRAIDGINHEDRSFLEARQWGVTTTVTGPGSANVIGGQFAAIKTYGRYVDEMIIKAPLALKIAFGENPKTVYNEKRQQPSTRMATAAILREQLFKAKEYKELVEDYNNDPEENDKPEYDMRMEALLPVLEGKIPLKAHAHRADDILTAIRIAEEFGLDLTLEHCTEGYIIKDILAEKGYDVVLGPILTDRSKIELKNQKIGNAVELVKAGVRVAIMTDHPCVPIQHLLLCAALCHREGLTENEALEAITINAAKAIRLDERIGSLEIGKDGDIVVLDGHPFDVRTRVKYTIIEGKIVYEG